MTACARVTVEAQLYACDLEVGLKWPGPTRQLSDDDFTSFARLTGDNHPIHYDAEYAAGTRFGRPVAHGLMLVGMTALGAAPVSERLRDSMVALIFQSADFLHPAMVGDTIACAFQCTKVEPVRRPEHKRVTIEVTLTNQRGQTVLVGSHVYLMLTEAVADGDPS